ncbi:MAG: hypothetical protein QM820_33870 [Minicystis sp.]
MATDEPNSLDHAVYADPAGAACARINGAGGGESWLGYSTFYLRACADLPIAETRNGDGDAKDDNCESVPVQIVRAESSNPGADGEASTLQFNNTYSNSFGGSVASVSLNANRTATANLSGATVQKSLTSNLGGWFSANLLNIWANGASNASLTGSASGGFSVFGTSYWSASSSSNNYQSSGGPSFNVSIYCMTYNLGVAGLGFNLSGCLNAAAGLNFTYDIKALNGAGPSPFNTATRHGQTRVDITPYANVSLVLSAYANIGVLQGGVTGNVMLLGVSFPSKDDLRWGLTTFSGKPAMIVTANTSLGLTFNTLSGYVYAWVKALEPHWCRGKWGIPYPCFEWNTIYNQNIISWTGGTTTLNIYAGNFVQLLQ